MRLRIVAVLFPLRLRLRTNSLASSLEYSPTSLSPASEIKILRATRGGV